MNELITPTIMIVEDDIVDIEAIQRLIQKRNLICNLMPVQNASRALELLQSQDQMETLERLIVLLDINMPGINGHQFLERVRREERLRRIIVFVLTTSDLKQDKELAYDQNVAGYFVKSQINCLIDTLEHYIKAVEFPPVSFGSLAN